MYYQMMPGTKLQKNSGCPLCNGEAFLDNNRGTEVFTVICPACGKFRFSEAAYYSLQRLKNERSEEMHILSHFIRSISERAIGNQDDSFFPIYDFNELEEMIDRPYIPVQEKLNMLLRHLGRSSRYPGHVEEFDAGNDYTVLCAKNSREANFYFETLCAQGLISASAPFTGRSNPRFTVSAQGWMSIERIARSGERSDSAFVAMWFDPSRTPSEAAIKQATRDAGYLPIRIDREEHLNHIDDEIITRIRQSRFLIADLTGQRTGVYFEAGFMLGLGRPVIWLCEKDDLCNVHFDTRQYNTIIYADTGDLERRLYLRIVANLGQGPNSATAVQ